MSFTGLALRTSDAASRWLLLGSLALNLFFVGVGGALLAQGAWSGTGEAPVVSDHSLAGRVDRIAATLPRDDGDRLRTDYRAHQAEIEAARDGYEQKRQAIHAALRAQPFDPAALRSAMAEARSARQVFDRRIQDFFAQEAAEMSSAGRQSLADWGDRHGERNDRHGERKK